MGKTKIVIFSDLHYAPERPVNNGSRIGRKLVEHAEPLLDKIITEINQIKPDLVLNLGDLIEDFNDHDKDIENLHYVWQKLKKMPVPFYSCIGNHDLRTMSSRAEVEQIMGYDNATFSFNQAGMHVIILGTFINKEMNPEDGELLRIQSIPEEDLKWLKNDLAKNRLPAIVCTHFGLAEDTMQGNWWFKDSPQNALLANRKEVKEILKHDKNLLAVFSGHQHWSKKIIEDKIPYYVVGSLTENINNDGIPDGVYFLVEFDGDKNLHVIKRHIKL